MRQIRYRLTVIRRVLGTFVLLVCALAISGQAQAQDKVFYHLYYGDNDRYPIHHFYSTSVTNVQQAQQMGYTWVGPTARVWSTWSFGRAEIQRLYNPQTGDHLYTIDQGEANDAQWFLGYVYETSEGYAYSTYAPGTYPVWRLYRQPYQYGSTQYPPDHYYTMNDYDLKAHESWSYQYERVAFYAGLP